MLGEHKEQGEVGRETSVKEGCEAKEKQVWQDTLTSLNDIMKKLFFWEWEQDPKMNNSRTGSKLIQI